MRVAIIGGGVSGIVAAARLHPRHEITLFESQAHLGGHAYTVAVEREQETWQIDMGFIVLNDRNYPRFRGLLEEVAVALQPTHMGFSVRAEEEDFEYAGTPRGVFCQRSNLRRPAFWRMLADLLRFNRTLAQIVRGARDEERSLAQFVEEGGYSRWFIDRLIVPQVSAVWSADPASLGAFPVRFLAEFLDNHGMLGFRDRPRWQTVVGGVAQLRRRAVGAVREARAARHGGGVDPSRRDGRHAAPGQRHGRALRGGGARLPRRPGALAAGGSVRRANASCSVPSPTSPTKRRSTPTRAPATPARRAPGVELPPLRASPAPAPTVTYYMNHLQRLDGPRGLLRDAQHGGPHRPGARDPPRQLRPPRLHAAAESPRRRAGSEISGVRRTRYCGAYWGWGFHEDGVVLRAARRFEAGAAMSASCAYEGWVRHRRHAPVSHELRMRLFMLYLDLDELPELFDDYRLASARGRSLAEFRRGDHLGDPRVPLASDDPRARRGAERTGAGRARSVC